MGGNMAFSHLRPLSVVLVLLTVTVESGASHAAMAVTDAVTNVKTSATVSELAKHTAELGEMKDQLTKQIDAIGQMGKITIPSLNIKTLANRLKKDAQCLIPDFEKLMPSLDMEDVTFNSLCSSRDFYRNNLMTNPEDLKNLSPKEWNEIAATQKKRREALFVDTVTNAIGQADQNIESAADMNQAADELQSAINGAQTQNARLAAIGQGQVALIRGSAQTNQLLAALLKLHATFYMEAGLPKTSTLSEAAEEEE